MVITGTGPAVEEEIVGEIKLVFMGELVASVAEAAEEPNILQVLRARVLVEDPQEILVKQEEQSAMFKTEEMEELIPAVAVAEELEIFLI